jgi:cytochrome c oxidase subunit 1
MWPRLTGKPLRSKTLARWQLWLWFWGMLITTIPWHIAGLMGQPRRVANFDYSMPAVARTAILVDVSVVGGGILLCSAVLLIVILVRSHVAERADARLDEPGPVPALGYALAVYPPLRVPAMLNGFALWNAVVLALMVAAYGYPIGQFFFLKPHAAPAYEVTRAGAARSAVQSP